MTGLYLYALLGSRPGSAARPGHRPSRDIARLRIVRCGRLFAAVRDVATPMTITPRSLRAHDTVVRRLAARVDALLPVRFGTVVPGPGELARLLAPRERTLREALRLVKGREQMTLRVYGRAATDPAEDDRDEAAPRRGPGTRHLRRVQLAHRRRSSVPEIAALREAFAPFVRAERVERHDAAGRHRRADLNAARGSHGPALIASVHHLIDRRAAPRYRAAVTRACRAHAIARPVRIVVRGPWPPYAFAPDAVA